MSDATPFNADEIRALIIDASTDFTGFDQPRFLNHVRRIADPLFAEINRLNAVAEQMRDVRRLVLKPGDVLALEVDRRLSNSEFEQLSAQVKQGLPDQKVMIVEMARLAVIERSRVDQPEVTITDDGSPDAVSLRRSRGIV